MGARRLAIVTAVVLLAGAGCSRGGASASRHVSVEGSSTAGAFHAVVAYPRSVVHGATVRLPMSFEIVGGRLASFQFDIAFDAPRTCQIHNMMSWAAVRGDVRPGAVVAALRGNHLPATTDPRTLGLWPQSGFNLRSENGVVRTRRDVAVPSACRGGVSFVVAARPLGQTPVVRRFRVIVT